MYTQLLNGATAEDQYADGKTGYSNTFGNDCSYNTLGSRVNNTITAIDYVRYVTFENGIQYVSLTCSDTGASGANYLQNVHIHEGVKETGTSSTLRKSIVISDRNNSFCTDVRTSSDVEMTV